jgi:flagellar basal body-associated protein FliL
VGPVVRKSNVVWLILGVLFFIFIIGIVIYLAVKGQQQQKKVEET